MKNDLSTADFGQNKSESLTPGELMKRHLKDPNHQVTDEEMRNLKVGIEAEDQEAVNEKAEDVEEGIENLPDNGSLPNPYQVIG